MCTQRAALTHRWPRRSRRCSRRFRKLACCTARRQARRRLTRCTRVPFLPHGPQRVGARSVSASYDVLQLAVPPVATQYNMLQRKHTHVRRALPALPRATCGMALSIDSDCPQSDAINRTAGASELKHLAYMSRLGLWGAGHRPASARPPHSAPHASIPNRTTHSTR